MKIDVQNIDFARKTRFEGVTTENSEMIYCNSQYSSPGYESVLFQMSWLVQTVSVSLAVTVWNK